MSRYRPAVWLPIDRYKAGGSSHIAMPSPRRLVLHTAVFDGTSLFPSMNVPNTPVSHFYIREDGTVEQYVDTDTRSSAVLDGNHDSITVESWDGARGFHGTDGPPWNEAQLVSLGKLAAWVHEIHGIPLTQLTSSKPGTTGVGWHRLGCDGNFPQPPGKLLGGRVSGGELWSPNPPGGVSGKTCPGDTRIRQVVDEVIPRAKNGDDMSAQDVSDIKDAVNANADRVIEVVRTLATAERERDAKRQGNLLAAVAKIPAGPEGSVDVAAVEQAIRSVFADAATPDE